MQLHTAKTHNRKITKRFSLGDNFQFLILCVPALIQLFIFAYLPMGGVIIAFKNFQYDLGILGSKWCGLNNFKFFFSSQDAWRIIRNTLGLNALFIITGLIVSVGIALLLYEIKQRRRVQIYQTLLILPQFISWVVVGYMSYALLNPNYGLINNLMKLLNMKPIDWYASPKYWPGMLMVANLWKGMGMSSIMYYAALMGIDKEYFEAAQIDGASKWQTTLYVSIPFLTPMMVILTILNIGNIFRADFGMFYNLTRDVGMLYSTTDVIDTYVFRALRTLGDVNTSSAVGLFQSIVGFILIIATNFAVRKIDPEKSLF